MTISQKPCDYSNDSWGARFCNVTQNENMKITILACCLGIHTHTHICMCVEYECVFCLSFSFLHFIVIPKGSPHPTAHPLVTCLIFTSRLFTKFEMQKSIKEMHCSLSPGLLQSFSLTLKGHRDAGDDDDDDASAL